MGDIIAVIIYFVFAILFAAVILRSLYYVAYKPKVKNCNVTKEKLEESEAWLKHSCESVCNSYKQTYDSLHNSLLNIKYQNIKFADKNIAVALYLLTDYMLGKYKHHFITKMVFKSIIDEGLYFEEFDNRLAFFAKFLNGKPTICDWAFEPPFSEAVLKDTPPLNLFIALWDVLYIPARLDNYDGSVRLITDFSYQMDIWKEFLAFLPTLTDFINKLYRVRYDLGL